MRTNNQFNFNLLWHDALSNYPVSLQQEVFTAVIKYAASGILTDLHDPRAQMAFDFIRTEIDARQTCENKVAADIAENNKQEIVSSPECLEPKETAPKEITPVNKLKATKLVDDFDSMYKDYLMDEDDYIDEEDEEDYMDEDDEDDYMDEEDEDDYIYDEEDFAPMYDFLSLDDFEPVCGMVSDKSLKLPINHRNDEDFQQRRTDVKVPVNKESNIPAMSKKPQHNDSLRNELRMLKKTFRLPCSTKTTPITPMGAACSRDGPIKLRSRKRYCQHRR